MKAAVEWFTRKLRETGFLAGYEKSAAELEMDAVDLALRAQNLRSKAAAIRKREQEAVAAKAARTPVDRTKVTLADGEPVTADHRELKANGQQKNYVVLADDERAKGFVRPFRDAYRHQVCGKITTMACSIAETYARDPFFYSGTFCTHCRAHFPVGEDGEFTWYEMDGREGPKVGT